MNVQFEAAGDHLCSSTSQEAARLLASKTVQIATCDNLKSALIRRQYEFTEFLRPPFRASFELSGLRFQFIGHFQEGVHHFDGGLRFEVVGAGPGFIATEFKVARGGHVAVVAVG